MGAKTLAGLKESGAVYLNAIGGAAQFYARCIERVDGVSLMEFGTPEAMWHLAGPRLSRRSSRWTRTATACTRTSKTASGKVLATLRGSAELRERGLEASSELVSRSVSASVEAARSRRPQPRAAASCDVDAGRRAGRAPRAPATSPSACARFSTENDSPPPESRVCVSSSAVSTKATHGVRSALVILPGRVQVARADAEGARGAWSASRSPARISRDRRSTSLLAGQVREERDVVARLQDAIAARTTSAGALREPRLSTRPRRRGRRVVVEAAARRVARRAAPWSSPSLPTRSARRTD